MADGYHSNSQKMRIITEQWVDENIFCPNCGKLITNYENNRPVADFYCSHCNEDYELKSKYGKSLGKTIADGVYHKMIERITSSTSPNFFFLNYDKSNYEVINFLAVPSYFFVPNMIIARSKGIPNRPNYIMCNIDISSIPHSGKIFYVKNKQIQSKDKVMEEWSKMDFLQSSTNIEAKGWLFDIMTCIDKTKKQNFLLADIYNFERYLKDRHPNNNNIQAKIRQQLQILRDKEYLRFEGKGMYSLQ